MDKVNNVVRAPQLVAGTDYMARIWGKDVRFEQVRFLGFGTAAGVIEGAGNKQLKRMTAEDRMHFQGAQGAFAAQAVDMCLQRATATGFERLTFSNLLQGTVAPVTQPVIEAPVVTPEAPTEGADEAPAAELPVADEGSEQAAEAPVEGVALSKAERIAALMEQFPGMTRDAARKRISRQDAKAAQEG